MRDKRRYLLHWLSVKPLNESCEIVGLFKCWFPKYHLKARFMLMPYLLLAERALPGSPHSFCQASPTSGACVHSQSATFVMCPIRVSPNTARKMDPISMVTVTQPKPLLALFILAFHFQTSVLIKILNKISPCQGLFWAVLTFLLPIQSSWVICINSFIHWLLIVHVISYVFHQLQQM